MREIRVSAIFSTLLAAGPLARTDLAQLTGYSPSAVTGIVQELSDAGYLRVTGQKESTGGRRRTLFELNRSAVTVAVVGFRGTGIWCKLVSLDGKQLDLAEEEFNSSDPINSTARIVRLIHGRAVTAPVHVVVALPGVVASDGSLALAPAFGSVSELHLADELEAATGIRATVENDVNLIAMGERVAGAGNGVDDLVLVHIEEGIGATIIANGEVLAGASRSAGEIGFLPQQLEIGVQGQRGDFETTWTVDGIRDAGLKRGLELPVGAVIESLCADDSFVARELLEEVIQAWAFAAIVCVCVVNPARVIYSGHAVHLDAASRKHLGEKVQQSAPSHADVVFAELGNDAILHGALAKVLKNPATLFTEFAR